MGEVPRTAVTLSPPLAQAPGGATGQAGPYFHKLHTVAAGETLWSLSQRYFPDLPPQAGVQKLAQANDLSDPSRIHGGQALVIPERAEYVAQLGDTLATVAAQFGTDVETLAVLNGIGLDHEVSAYPVDGKRLVVPVPSIPVSDTAEPLDADHEAHSEPLDADHEAHFEPLDADHEAHFEPLDADHEAHSEPLDADHEAHSEPLDADHETHAEPLDADHEGISGR